MSLTFKMLECKASVLSPKYGGHVFGMSDRIISIPKDYLLTYCPSCHRQLGQQQILSISGGLEPVSVRFPMNVPWLSPLPQQYVSMSSLNARVFCVPLVSIRLLLLGWSFDLCVIYCLSISSVYVQLWFL